jgi:hypothetical protein
MKGSMNGAIYGAHGQPTCNSRLLWIDFLYHHLKDKEIFI